MKWRTYLPASCVAVFGLLLASVADGAWRLDSPNGKTAIIVELDETDGTLSYTVEMDGQTVIEKSPMGIVLEDADLSTGLAFDSEFGDGETQEDSYQLTQGKQIDCTRKLCMSGVVLKKDGKQLLVVMAAMDDAVAFYYAVPGLDDESYRVTDETTGFKIPAGSTFWAQPYDKISKWTPAYERFYENGQPAGMESTSEQGWAYPMLFALSDDRWILLTEAGPCDGYCATRLEQKIVDNTYRIRFPDPGEGNGVGEVDPQGTGVLHTPWRTIILGQGLADIVESTTVTALNPESAIEDTSWIKPGRASWSWISDHGSPKDANRLKPFVDLAAEMGWEYTLIDANWNMMENGTVEDVIAYCKEKNVGPLIWLNGGGPHNTVTEAPRDTMLPENRANTFKQLQDWGVRGVKVDFFQSDKQATIQLYHDILKDAADHKMLVNFHGCTVPRGWSRTWPNLMTMEAVFGAEAYSFNESYAAQAPVHNTILPFSRNVVGPMDYTPVMFNDNKYPHITSNAHELALSVVFQSGILHFADSVEGFRAQPQPVKNFLKNVPVVWDETRYVAGYPGKNAVIARRNGDRWWVGGISGENEAKALPISFAFLGQGQFEASIIADGQTPREFGAVAQMVTAETQLSVPMQPNGGFVIQITPKK